MAGRVVVLKFGSSVLRDDRGVWTAVLDIYREVRRGRRVVAVVSAPGRTTDELLARAHAVAPEPAHESLAALLATGERAAAALLALALDAAGVPARLLDPADIRLRLTGHRLDADPAELDAAALRGAMRSCAAVVLPGFFGVHEAGGTALLGRGGSDCTALFVAHRLRASCRLLKDVDGVYESDPALGDPRRYRTLRFDHAQDLGAKVVQPRALALAQRHAHAFEVASPGAGPGTLVGAGTTATAHSRPAPPPLRVVLLGHGTVGREVHRQLAEMPGHFRVVRIAVRDPAAHAARGAAPEILTADAVAAARADGDVVVELMGGSEPAATAMREALAAGRHVVTANKAAVAEWGPSLEALACERGVRLLYSAAVGAAVPALERVRRIIRGDRIARIDAVLNGTTNFILDRIQAGATHAAATAEAQRRGFAEADPTFDLDGTDAAQKLAILARTAFSIALPWREIPRRGLQDVSECEIRAAAAEGRTVRLVASAWRTGTGVRAIVVPRFLAARHPLALAREEGNAVLIRRASGRNVLLNGKGAGAQPTAVAVLADLLDLRRALVSPRHGQPTPPGRAVLGDGARSGV